MATPLVVASPLTASPYCADLIIFEVLSDPQPGEGDVTLAAFIMGPCAQVVNSLWGHHLGSDPEDGRHSRPSVDPSSPSPLKELFVPESPSPVLAGPLGPSDDVVPESPLPSPPSLALSPHTGPLPMTPTPVVSPPLTTPPETVPKNPTVSKTVGTPTFS